MELNNFTIDSFNKHKPYIYLFLFEKEPINIYQDLNYEIIISRSSDINFKMVKIVEIISENGLLTFGVEIRNNIIGYIQPISSIVMIPKNVKQVRVDKEANFNNELNQMLKIDENHFTEKQEKVAFSRHYAVFENMIFESVVLKDEIIGFFESEDINNMYKVKLKFKVTNKTVAYRDNAMTKKLSVLSPENKFIETDYIMPSENKLRFKHKGSSAWISIYDTDLEYDIEDNVFNDINELLLTTILNQYKEKIDNYHEYYHRILKRNQ